METALAGIHPDGTWSKETALAAFVASFGPLPGVDVPASSDEVGSGTLALEMVALYWSDLTDQQRSAIRDYVGPNAASALPAAYQLDDALTVAAQQMVEQAESDIAAHVGHRLTIPVKVGISSGTTRLNAAAWTWANWPLAGQPPNACIVTVQPKTVGDAVILRFAMLHEVWHCYQLALVDRATALRAPKWIIEGEAQWVAEAITNGAGIPYRLGEAWWDRYIDDPETALYGRAYDAEGFYAQMAKSGTDPWKLLEPMVVAGGNEKAFEVAGANDPAFLDAWGSSWYRDGLPSEDWAMATGYGIPGEGERPDPKSVDLADDGASSFDVLPTTALVVDLDTTAFVTHVHTVGGARVGDPAGALDLVVRDGDADICTASSRDCSCPPGPDPEPTSPPVAPAAGQVLRVAAAGDESALVEVDLNGISKDEWCRPQPKGLKLFVDGTLGGKPVKGQVIADPATGLTCYANSPGSPHAGNLVHWSGYAADTKTPIAGEFDVEYGTWSLGNAQGDRSITIDEIVPVYQHLSSVSGTITQNPSGGSIDAVTAEGGDTIHVTGSWTCPAPGASQ